MADIEITGIEEVCANLEQMPARIQKVALGKALVAGVKPIMDAVAPRIPIGVTGELGEALMFTVDVSADGRGGVAQVGFGKQGFKARMVEFGHRMVGHKPNKTDKGKTVPAHPFMRPAAETAAPASVQAFADSIKESLDGGLV